MAVSFAFIVFAWTSFWFAGFSTDSTFWQLVEPRIVQGIAIAFFFIPLNQIIIAGLRPDQIASASGLANFFRTLASSVSTAVTVTLWQHRAEYHHAVLAEQVSLGNPGAVAYIDKVHALGLHGPPTFGLIDLIVSQGGLYAGGERCVLAVRLAVHRHHPAGVAGATAIQRRGWRGHALTDTKAEN